MRRQGRQNGIVRSYRILPPPLNTRPVNSLTSPQTSELLTTLPSKPTKAQRKVWPGQVHWVRSYDIASSSYKLLTWRVKTEPVLNLPSFSDPNNCEDNVEDEAGVETVKTEHNGDNGEKEDGGSHDYDESMSFYDVGMMMMEHVLDDNEEEDGWCLV
ncbi:hypothetical protein ISN45_Aa05g005760 [Arabidopsis thaliana x Arabidopsis arenosa]|uniref:Uncharacterized protein n=1 Tax=Arabidopsis thaliana x Arabidopsis arenosa TaxID=1240361 RepID=A0A8T1ZI52_9BRAS|nr:hypothetical protein ISN45_Aa05g005760 [Arabidopsis thaliana x Arabidopsis arenosa]